MKELRGDRKVLIRSRFYEYERSPLPSCFPNHLPNPLQNLQSCIEFLA
ncbi:hypothetical protein H6F88_14350 [Oculatella sp. FACHB-28]|nr:hypothetical protein [Oculatella sp. FACHB-28]